jgi:Ca2+-binding EF-hand superfamily protein
VDKNGRISASEIKQILVEKEMSKASEAKINAVISKVDKNEDGEIDYVEFLTELGIKR